MFITLLCLAISQEPAGPKPVQDIVDLLVKPVRPPGMPARYAANRVLRAEVAGLEPQPKPVDDEMEEEAVVVPDMQNIKISMECFDAWMFGNMTNEEIRKAWLDGRLRDKLLGSGQLHRLSHDEIARLHLAGRGDIKRLLTDVDKKRVAFEAQRQNIQNGQAALVALKPISMRFQNGPFDENSIYNKTLAKILDDRKALK